MLGLRTIYTYEPTKISAYHAVWKSWSEAILKLPFIPVLNLYKLTSMGIMHLCYEMWTNGTSLEEFHRTWISNILGRHLHMHL